MSEASEEQDLVDSDQPDSLLDEIMLDVAAAENNIFEQAQSLEDIMKDTEYLDLDLDKSFESGGSSQNTPKKTPLNLAIPAGGIDADISDTLSVKSWDSKHSALSRPSAGLEQKSEYGSIMRHVILKAVSSQLSSAVERLQAGLLSSRLYQHQPLLRLPS